MVTEPAGAGPAEARNAGVAGRSSEVVAFVDADVVVEPEALARLRAPVRRRPGPRRRVRQLRRRPAAPGAVSRFRNLLHHHVHTTSAGPGGDLLGRARRGPPRGVRGRRRLRRRALRRRRRWRTSSSGCGCARAGRLDRARPGDPRHAPEALDAALDGRAPTSLRRGRPLDAAAARGGRGLGALNLGWRHRLSALAARRRRRSRPSPGARAPRSARWRRWSALNLSLLRAASPARRAAPGRRRRRAARSSIT